MNKKERLKRFNRELPMTQKFCPNCGGLISLHVNGLLVKPIHWIRYGLASDIGCVCNSSNK